VRVWTGFKWLRIGTDGGLLWTLQWLSDSVFSRRTLLHGISYHQFTSSCSVVPVFQDLVGNHLSDSHVETSYFYTPGVFPVYIEFLLLKIVHYFVVENFVSHHLL
jgi:hypothetical protein